ncbi:MAG: hypothetical protein IKD53_11615 [Clostridia bacterium]|nr:hypothetical protein [Clostridia bacterium]
MPDEEKLVKALSLQERKEAIEEELDWIDQQISIVQSIYNRRMAWYNRLREAALKTMRDIIHEETRRGCE